MLRTMDEAEKLKGCNGKFYPRSRSWVSFPGASRSSPHLYTHPFLSLLPLSTLFFERVLSLLNPPPFHTRMHPFHKPLYTHHTNHTPPEHNQGIQGKKVKLSGCFSACYSQEVSKQTEAGTPPDAINVDLRTLLIRELACRWLLCPYDYIRSHPNIISNGIQKGRDHQCLEG